MASRGRDSVYEERETYYRDGPGGPPPRRRSPPRGGRYTDLDGREPPPLREREMSHVRVRESSRSRDRTPAFLRDQDSRPADGGGAMVLRSRQVETVERPRARPRSPSPQGGVRIREQRMVRRARSLTPPPPREMVERDRVEVRERVIERDREVGRGDRRRSPSRGPAERVRETRFYERERERSPSPSPQQLVQRTRVVETRRGRSPSPVAERERIRVVDIERERYPSPSPSPPPPPPPHPEVIRGPTIEREVITHYRDIDHGMIVARPPSPPPPPRRKETRERDTEIDIYTSRHHTEVDIHESSRERRAPSRERLPPPPAHRPHTHYSDDVHVHSERDGRRLEVDVDIHSHKHSHSHGRERSRSRRRAHSAAPPRRNDYYDDDDLGEGAYITSKIESRGKMGEAYHGATRNWTIVDVPPGTERVQMDGVGGGGADVTWSKYSGVRRAKFVPERERDGGAAISSTSLTTTTVSDRERERERERESRLSVAIYDKERDVRERETSKEVTTVDVVTDRRVSMPQKRSEMWTEITKDLVVREAIEELGYEYEETEWFFYVMTYLRYEDVLHLVQLSDRIRRIRKDRIREIQWEREDRAAWEHRHRHRHRHHGRSRSRHRHHHSHSRSRDGWDETVVTRDVVYR